MKSNGLPASTKFGWILVGGVLVGLFFGGVFIGGSVRTFRHRTEALGRRLISDFHEEYNSAQLEAEPAQTTPELAAIQQNRPNLGKFNKLESCQIKGYIEPSSVRAKCVSVLEKGKAEESFVFRYYADDHRLLSYKATPQH